MTTAVKADPIRELIEEERAKDAGLKDANDKLSAKQKAIREIFDEAGPERDFSKVTSLEGDTQGKVEKVRAMMQDADEAAEAISAKESEIRLRAYQRYAEEPVRPYQHPAAPKGDEGKTPGQRFVESDEFKATIGKSRSGKRTRWEDESVEDPVAAMKALFLTSDGFPPESTRTGRIVEAALLGPQVLDLIPSVPTDQAAVVFMRETVTTEAAAERAEGAAYAEADISYAEDSSTVRSIGVSLPVTDEQLEDVPGVQGLLDGRLRFFLRRRVDGQVLVGDGIAPNLEGVLNVTGIQTYALAAEPVFDAISKGITLVQITGAATPNGIVMHPNDYQDMRLTRTADGIYILGNPADPTPLRVWGLPVAISDRQTENTALVGDFAGHSELRPRRGIEVEIGFSGTQFVEGEQTIRAGLRTAFVVYRSAAFCTVTGI